MKWILGITVTAVLVGMVATMTVPAQTVTPDEATLKLFPTETQGIAFVDLAGLRAAPLFSEFVMQKLPRLPRDAREFQEATGFDLQRDVDKVTAAYMDQRDVLVIVQARYDHFKVEQFVKDKAGTIATETYLGRVIYKPDHHSDGDSDSDAHEGGFSFIDNMIIGGNLARVKQAIDRLAAPAPNVMQNTELVNQIRTIEIGNQIWAVGKFDVSMFGINAQQAPGQIGEMVHSLRGGSYQMRIDQDLHLKAIGSFGSAEMAKATNDMLRGLLAMGKLQVAQEQRLTQLLDGVSVENAGETVTVNVNARGELLKEIHDGRVLRGLVH
jgi:hypothetical protein